MPEEINEQVLEVIRSEVDRLKNDFDERWVTGLRHLVLGEKEQARAILLDLAGADETLTYIKAYLESKYKQVINLH